jgi:hypothetical protein
MVLALRKEQLSSLGEPPFHFEPPTFTTMKTQEQGRSIVADRRRPESNGNKISRYKCGRWVVATAFKWDDMPAVIDITYELLMP